VSTKATDKNSVSGIKPKGALPWIGREWYRFERTDRMAWQRWSESRH